jgi:predicted Fe-Mo cluster-binding NifX family protein/uncharacterized protein (DUF302 family)
MQIGYTAKTEKSTAEAVRAVVKSAEAHGFLVQFVHDVEATLAEKGFDREPVTIVEMCNAKAASAVLAADVMIGLMLPCPVMVHERAGEVFISTMRPTLMGSFFPEAGIEDVAADVERAIFAIVDEAANAQRLRIAVPTEGEGGLDVERSGHFGHAASFTLVDTLDGGIADVSVLENGPHAHGACGSIVHRLAEAGVDTVIAAGMGGGPRAGFAAAGIPVFFDADTPTPRTAVEAFLSGARETFGDEHACRGH